ncbi:MAG TPA: kelch repeat-containing protein [Thermoanaerobaculia bacterium]|jgi:hypothetical protein|nr:kelch repeat-containing protein [Thermoanaerobaculia bacterium]
MRKALFPALLLLALTDVLHAGTITRVGSLGVLGQGGTMTALHDGRVLVVGGPPSRRIEIFDPGSGQTTVAAAVTPLPLNGHTATRLHDGSVLITGGGFTPAGGDIIGDNYGSYNSDTFDGVSSMLIAAGTLHSQRMSHTATLLADGRVLVTGGENIRVAGFYWRAVFETAEIFDPATRTFVRIRSMTERRASHSATRLKDGRVLIAGGSVGDAYSGIMKLATLEIFDPQTETFTATGSMQAGRSHHSATLLSDGRVLILGGGNPTAEVFDPATNAVQTVPAIEARFGTGVFVLADGRVLVTGGSEPPTIFDPALNGAVETLSGDRRFDARIVKLDDGSMFFVEQNSNTVFRYRPTPAKPRRRAVR